MCSANRVNFIGVERDTLGDFNLFYDTDVNILAGNGTETNMTGECLVGVRCTSYHYVQGYFSCDKAEAFPSNVSCWTNSDSATPVCDRPGSTWKNSLTGTILAAIFATLFISIALAIDKGFNNPPPPAAEEVEVVGVVTAQTIPVVRAPASSVVVGSPINK